MKIKTLLITSLAALLIPAFASAEDSAFSDNAQAQQCDKSGNSGPKSKKHKIAKHIKKVDSNQDRQISLDEAESANAERLLEQFAEIDADGDQTLTREEMKAFRQAKRAEHQAQEQSI